MEKNKRRKHCEYCNDEFSDRHFRRHNCHVIQDIDGPEEESRSTDGPEVTPTNPASSHFFQTPGNHQDINITEEDRLTYFDQDESDYLSSTDEETGDESGLDAFMSDSDTDTEGATEPPTHKAYILWILKAIAIWQSSFFLPSTALSFILILIKSIFCLCAPSSALLKALYDDFPASIYQMHKFLSYKKDQFKKYVVCTKCYTLYNYDECVQLIEGRKVTKLCRNVSYPFHPLVHLRKSCGEKLLKNVELQGRNELVPFKTYCYRNLQSSLINLVSRPGFEEKCESWRKRKLPDDVMTDVFDGNIWHDFSSGMYDFLSHERSYGLMLNVDWFQPFKRTTYSVGAIYLAILNLPREERFKRENVILVGLMPDMRTEPPTNTFIEPLVDELKVAWNGFYLKSFSSPDNAVLFRLALLCVGCDIPASRKLVGFLGHSATQGCNKCEKAFLGGIGQINYGGFNTSEWNLRSGLTHRQRVQEVVRAKTKTTKEQLESKYGVRYSCLLELHYFDPVRMNVVDPMHNLFLGTAKRMLNVWKTTNKLSDKQMELIEDKMQVMHCPSDIGKLPKKFSSCYGSFTADQWKNRTLIFSIFALKGILPPEDLECWRKFVLACKMLSTRTLQKSSVEIAHRLLLSFCRKFEELYEQNLVTPNMHMHAHLHQCIKDFGPIYSFWLFSFERENGLLESMPTNKKNIEVQLMRRFMENVNTFNIACNSDLLNDFGADFMKLVRVFESSNRGTLGDMSHTQQFDFIRMSSRNFNFHNADWSITDGIQYSALKSMALTDEEIPCLMGMYAMMYPKVNWANILVCNSYKLAKHVSVYGNVLGTRHGRSCRSSMILAHWCGVDGNITDYDSVDLSPRPGQIDKFILHNVTLDGISYMHLIAKVTWFTALTDELKNMYGKPVDVWGSDIFAREGPATFIPVQRIKSKFVYAYQTIRGRRMLIVCPRDRYLA